MCSLVILNVQYSFHTLRQIEITEIIFSDFHKIWKSHISGTSYTWIDFVIFSTSLITAAGALWITFGVELVTTCKCWTFWNICFICFIFWSPNVATVGIISKLLAKKYKSIGQEAQISPSDFVHTSIKSHQTLSGERTEIGKHVNHASTFLPQHEMTSICVIKELCHLVIPWGWGTKCNMVVKNST